MKACRIFALFLLLFGVISASSIHSPALAEIDSALKSKAITSYGKLPLSFERNEGQVDGRVMFLARWGGRVYWFTRKEVVLEFSVRDRESEKVASLRPMAVPKNVDNMRKRHAVGISFPGSNPDVRMEGIDQQAGKVNYFTGEEKSGWRTNAPIYNKIIYRNLWNGVDLRYEGRGGNLKYEFEVAPGGDPGVIRLAYAGIEGLRISDSGALVISTKLGDMTEARPFIYQLDKGSKKEIRGAYQIMEGNRVGFVLHDYDRKLPLVIDPLVYSSYLGGTNNDYGFGIAVDGSGNAYVTGWTLSSVFFPILNPYQATYAGVVDAFVTKIDPTGSALVYSTYLGGSGFDFGLGIAVDGSGNAYVTGWTSSTNFPTLNPYQASNAGMNDAFVTKIDPTGSALVYSTYLGGSGIDGAYDVAVDGSGGAYVAGDTESTNFPTANPYQPAHAGMVDAFITRVDPTGSALVYSTYLGGSGNDGAAGIALDGSGSGYVTGSTESTDFPAANPYQPAYAGDVDAFVTRIDPTGSALVYSTYLGGSAYDSGNGVAVDGFGNAYVIGSTESTDFPTVNPYQSAHAGVVDVFVARISASGSALDYSTYLGGSGNDSGNAIAVDTLGYAYVTGVTESMDAPTMNPFQPLHAGEGLGGVQVAGDVEPMIIPFTIPYQPTQAGAADAFVTVLYGSGPDLVYSTYLGGSNGDYGFGIAVDGSGNAYVTGWTFSPDFPTVSPFQGTYNGFDVFVAKVPASRLPVHRFWSPTFFSHFYTMSDMEKNLVMANPDWIYEGVAWYAYAAAHASGTLPVYRFWSPVFFSHFYTISDTEKNLVMANPDWVFEGVAYHAYSTSLLVDLLPVYRFWSPVFLSHFYTISDAEKAIVMANPDWIFEGTAWFAFPSP
ncbi:MAG: SBBP repeat-containing protein [Deltaproteobacteria bacterium]|nr:SBBP repeat-containing protein [Deltaproteobacteria bacterium]